MPQGGRPIKPRRIFPALMSQPSQADRVAIRSDSGISHVVSLVPIGPDEVVVHYRGAIVSAPAMYTLQIDEHRHLGPSGTAADFVNHSCEPNCAIDFDRLCLVALRPISPGEEITFNYLTTEWELAAPFECRCGATQCMGTLRGFKQLAPAERRALEPHLSPFLRGRLESG